MKTTKTTKTTESVPKPVGVKDNTPKIINVTAKLDVNVKTQSDDINVEFLAVNTDVAALKNKDKTLMRRVQIGRKCAK